MAATSVYLLPGTELASVDYWQVGDGLPANGGCIGWDATYTWRSSGKPASEVLTRPAAGAVTITEAEYQTIYNQILAS